MKENDIRGCAITTKGPELPVRGGVFVFFDLLHNENNPDAGGNLLRPLLQYLRRDHLQSIKGLEGHVVHPGKQKNSAH